MIDQKEEIQLMLSARFPLLWVVSPEEETAEEMLCDAALAKKAQIYFWTLPVGGTIRARARGPDARWERIIKAPSSTAAVLS
jgi:hypothetical protein